MRERPPLDSGNPLRGSRQTNRRLLRRVVDFVALAGLAEHPKENDLPPAVQGVELDPQTRCAHYHGATDIIAIKMKCCGVYYACKDCHQELAGHAIETWPEVEWAEKAIMCGACGTELNIREYMRSNSTCPACQARFNPGCRNHYPFYFDVSSQFT
ncbi:MAG TPA: CHY zinc finger protein [Terriglobales bacterium]|nr:CHY zinc finger protein [Terriglobales bacterium]